MAAPIRVVATAFTHVGAVRAGNEDTIAVGDWLANGAMAAPEVLTRTVDPPVLALVADGMGGHAAGEVASGTAAGHLNRRAGEAGDASALARLLEDANAELFALMDEEPVLRGMGTTIAGVAVTPDACLIFNVGDSRVYGIEGHTLEQLSTDDTPGPKLADGRTAARTSNLITQSLGGAWELRPIEPHVLTRPLRADARYLICSDGLSDLVARQEMERLLRDDDRASVNALFEAAMAHGGRDNVSIIILRLAGPA